MVTFTTGRAGEIPPAAGGGDVHGSMEERAGEVKRTGGGAYWARLRLTARSTPGRSAKHKPGPKTCVLAGALNAHNPLT
eukprot:2129667-Alexandrium_andersonii.AAC.1